MKTRPTSASKSGCVQPSTHGCMSERETLSSVAALFRFRVLDFLLGAGAARRVAAESAFRADMVRPHRPAVLRANAGATVHFAFVIRMDRTVAMDRYGPDRMQLGLIDRNGRLAALTRGTLGGHRRDSSQDAEQQNGCDREAGDSARVEFLSFQYSYGVMRVAFRNCASPRAPL